MTYPVYTQSKLKSYLKFRPIEDIEDSYPLMVVDFVDASPYSLAIDHNLETDETRQLQDPN